MMKRFSNQAPVLVFKMQLEGDLLRNASHITRYCFQVCRMASDYSRTCVSPDSIQTGDAPVVSETCEVYVWGSNSSHQLVEGTQEKILQPKLAASFADAQTVWLGDKSVINMFF